MLYHAVLYYTLLYCIVLCYAMLCYAILYQILNHAISDHTTPYHKSCRSPCRRLQEFIPKPAVLRSRRPTRHLDGEAFIMVIVIAPFVQVFSILVCYYHFITMISIPRIAIIVIC